LPACSRRESTRRDICTMSTVSAESDKHSQSTYIQPLENPTAYAKATFVPFAPQPCYCCGCLANQPEQLRTYAVVYDSKLEVNIPCAPCCCCSTEQCIVDRVQTMFMDKPPFRSGMCCVCIPCTCCGPPVIYSKTPKCCTMDLTWAFGQQIFAAPSNIYGLKTMICCCAPCYTCCACPLVSGLNDSQTFVENMKAASDAYYLKHPEIPTTQRVIYEAISDDIIDTKKTVGGNETMERHP